MLFCVWGTHHTYVHHRGSSIFHSRQQCTRVQFLHVFSNTCYFLFLFLNDTCSNECEVVQCVSFCLRHLSKCTQLFCVHVKFYISNVMLLISSSGLLFALGTVFKIHPFALCTEYSVASDLHVLCGGHQPYPRCVCRVLCVCGKLSTWVTGFLTATLPGTCEYYFHFTEEETDIPRVKGLAQSHRAERDRTGN